MALTIVGYDTGTASGSGVNQLDVGGLNYSSGQSIILCLAAGGDVGAVVDNVSDSKGNTWTRAGTTRYIYYTHQNAGVLTFPNNSIFVNFDSSDDVSIAYTTYYFYGDVSGIEAFVASGVNNGTGTSATITSSSITSGDIIVGVTNIYGTSLPAVTQDSDTSNGTWEAHRTTIVTAMAEDRRISSQTKVTTGTGTQTYNTSWTGSKSYYISWASFTETIVGGSYDPMGTMGFFGI